MSNSCFHLASHTETVELLRGIVGKPNVLTDVEDLYVYSFEQIHRERHPQEILAVVRTDKAEEVKKVAKVTKERGYSLVPRGRIHGFNNSSNPIIMLDDHEQLDLKPYEKPEEPHSDDVKEFHEAESGTLKKLALARRLLFLDRPASKCEDCRICSSYCTVASSFNGVETWSAKGRMLLMRAIARRELPISPKILDVLYTCSNCGLCFAECLQRSELQEAIRAARRQVVVEGHTPDMLKATARNILEVGDPGRTSPKQRFSWLEKVPTPHLKEKADILYWVGCTSGVRTPKTAKAVSNILGASGSDFALLGREEGCCGYVLIASGLWDDARKNATNVAEKVARVKAETMVTSCAGCYYTFSKLYPEILDVEVPCEVLHTSQLIEDLMNEGILDVAGVDKRVTFHDPCSLGRHAGVYDAPRNVLKRIPKLQLVEMSLSKDRARCCGGGGGLWSYNNRVSMNSAWNRLTKDVAPLNVSALATACPTCQMNLRYASIRNSFPIHVCDLAEIAEMAMVNAANS